MRTLPRVGALLAAGTILLTGCQGNGGGWIPSDKASGEKATFGFSFTGNTNYEGSFSGTFKDPRGSTKVGSQKVQLKGTGRFRGSATARDLGPVCVTALGVRYTIPKGVTPRAGWDRSDAWTMNLSVCDHDHKSGGSDDTISLDVTGGPYEGYSTDGDVSVGGGNFTVR